jgi:hypothetical protein
MRSVLRLIPGETSAYGHSFGGPAMHKGAHFGDAQRPLQLLYCLNLSDPALDINRPDEDVDVLPLYYGFQFDGCRFGYLTTSNDSIRVFSDKQAFIRDFPYPEYPAVFPKTPVRIEPLAYDDIKTLIMAHVLYQEGDWSFTRMSDADRNLLMGWGYPFTQVGDFHRLTQGSPDSPCPNPSCNSYGRRGAMKVFATVWNRPIPGLSLWGDEGDFVELVYEQCHDCGAIGVSNQCD